MTKPIFSRTYFKSGQDKFEQALKEGELETAVGILETLPPASKGADRYDRATILIEGYAAIIHNFIAEIPREERRIETTLERDLTHRLAEYEKIGSVKDIKYWLDRADKLEHASNNLPV